MQSAKDFWEKKEAGNWRKRAKTIKHKGFEITYIGENNLDLPGDFPKGSIYGLVECKVPEELTPPAMISNIIKAQKIAFINAGKGISFAGNVLTKSHKQKADGTFQCSRMSCDILTISLTANGGDIKAEGNTKTHLLQNCKEKHKTPERK